MSRIAIATAALLCLAVATASAEEARSVYTKIDLRKCKAGAQVENGAVWTCKGVTGYPLTVAEGDLRMYLAYGKNHEAQRAETQTLSPFNTFAEKKNKATLEWRLKDGAPYATILRYKTSSDASGTMVNGEVLVVAKVGAKDGKDACHVAYVDALANADANELARKAADDLAATFDCAKDPTVVGKSGKSPM